MSFINSSSWNEQALDNCWNLEVIRQIYLIIYEKGGVGMALYRSKGKNIALLW